LWILNSKLLKGQFISGGYLRFLFITMSVFCIFIVDEIISIWYDLNETYK
jgi:hypothetical protein